MSHKRKHKAKPICCEVLAKVDNSKQGRPTPHF